MKKSVFYIFIILSALAMMNCQGKKTSKSVDLIAKLYQDSVFLEVEGDLSRPFAAWNQEIYGKAFSRMMRYVYLKDGLLAWDLRKGADIRISENIFDYVVKFLKYNNEVNLPSGDYEIRQDVQTGFYHIVLKKLPDDPASWRRVNE